MFKRNPFLKTHSAIDISIKNYQATLLKDLSLKLQISVGNEHYNTELSEWTNRLITFMAPLKAVVDPELGLNGTPQLSPLILPREKNVKITFISHSALYVGSLTILSREEKEGKLYYIGELTSPLLRKQQRQFYRLDILLDMHYRCFENETLPEHFNALPLEKAIITNISVGGLCMSIDKILKDHTMLWIDFEFLDTPITLIGKVLSHDEKTEGDMYSHRIQFKMLDHVTESNLHRLIITRQRQLLKKPKFYLDR